MRTRTDSLRWTVEGTRLLVHAIGELDDDALDAPSGLPGWSRRTLIAHIAANADALSNLVYWAATGEETPMYASPEARAAGIAEGAAKPTATLVEWVRSSASQLDSAMSRLSDEQWLHPVRTAQGRTVAADEIPWMRAREACVHAVDLDAGIAFADLPSDFLLELGDDIVAKRNRTPAVAVHLTATDTSVKGAPATWALRGPDSDPDIGIIEVFAPLSDVVAYLSGRAADCWTVDGTPAPTLPSWL